MTACSACGAHVLEGDAFCESCGATLELPVVDVAGAGAPAPAGACRECGGVIAGDGWCGTCGAAAPRERDHWVEQPAPWVAGVCDRGIRHERNEDALAIAAEARPGGVAVMVVCDGVSSAPGSDVASLAAARAARDVLCQDGTPTGGRTADEWGALVTAAASSANEAAAETAGDRSVSAGSVGDLASCTFVAAVVDGPLVVAGCVGDSRAYWLSDQGGEFASLQLTTDDSWAAEQIAAGVPRDRAESGPHAHSITRWLGRDSPDHAPTLRCLDVPGAGWVMVCSDGLWNYCSEAEDLAALVAQVQGRTGPDPAAIAAELVAWANGQGGHDNISVALARVGQRAE